MPVNPLPEVYSSRLATPTILSPHDVPAFSTNRQEIVLAGQAIGADLVFVNSDYDNVFYNPVTGDWNIALVLAQGENNFVVRSMKEESIIDSQATNLILDSQMSSPLQLPTGCIADSLLVYDARGSYYSQSDPTWKLFTRDVDYIVTGGGPDRLIITRIDGGDSQISATTFVKVYVRIESYSAPAEITIYCINTRELSFRTHAPIGAIASSFLDKVIVSWVKPADARIDGFNVYASTSPQGLDVPYRLLTPIPVSIPSEISSTSQEINAILSSVRRLNNDVGTKIIDEIFDSLAYWMLSPADGGAVLAIQRGYQVLGFSSLGTQDVAVYKLRQDFSGGSRTYTKFERKTNEVYALGGIHLADLSTIGGVFDPAQYIGVRWEANTGTVICYAPGGYSYSSLPSAYTNITLTVDIVVTGENYVEFYLDGVFFHRTPTSVDPALIRSVPISVAGRRDMVVHDVWFTKGEWVDDVQLSDTEVKVSQIERYELGITTVLYPEVADSQIYVVVTSVGFDPNLGEEVESTYSDEVLGALLPTLRQYFDQPMRLQKEIRVAYGQALTSRDPLLDLKPGSVPSDIFIGPPSVEFERTYIMLDFVSRAQSFVGLLDIDFNGANQILVSSSTYKRRLRDAFKLTDAETQTMVDSAYDRLAANVNVFRKAAEPATGEVTFYTSSRPTADLSCPAGTLVYPDTAAQNKSEAYAFKTLSRATIEAEFANSYFNPLERRWEVTVKVQAVTPGEGGNISAGRLTLHSGSGFEGVTNSEPTTFGQNEENNRELAERAMLAFVSVDVGTFYGYKRAISEEALVRKSMVVPTEHPLMKRTWDPLVNRYIGGKADIYVRGESLVSVTDSYSIQYPTIQDSTSVIVSSAAELTFTITDPNVTQTTPLFKVISVFNETKGREYAILIDADVIYVDYRTFKLNPYAEIGSVSNITVGVKTTDVLRVTYKYRAPRTFLLDRRPVASVSRVSIRVPGEEQPRILSSGSHWNFYVSADPLLEGGSINDPSYLLVRYSDSDRANLTMADGRTINCGLPTGYTFPIVDERHILVAALPSKLINLGVDRESIIVTSLDGHTTYTEGEDFFVRVVSTSYSTFIGRMTNGNIDDGDTVLVSYQAGEQIDIEYVYDSVITRLQEKISSGELQRRHITADILVKKAVEVPIVLDLSVVLKESANMQEADRKIRTAVSRYVSQLKLGESLYQSDVIGVIEQVPEVSYVIVPFSIMAKQTGAGIHRERISVLDLIPFHIEGAKSFQVVSDTSVVTTSSNRLNRVGSLNYPPRENGGNEWEFHQLYEDNYPYKMMTDSADVRLNYGRAHVDNAGIIVVSPFRGLSHFKQAIVELSYVIFNDTRVMNIEVGDFEYVVIGTCVLSIARVGRDVLGR